ncbi:MAG TPA: DUF1549 and DUF1553 domain-containing protein [Verrucomicrobiae bacterium]|jgi:hypothetical protein|nr:DUF1549 and DUF1553 domain-containing protein [Verrucomicrobiae bacterium]
MKPKILYSGFLLVALSFGRTVAAKEAEKAIPRPPLPPITVLQLEPAQLTLHDARDARRVLVWGKTADGQKVDLTSEAVFTTQSEALAIEADKYISPRAKGEGEVFVSAAGQSTHLPVMVENADNPPIRFVRDVVPIMSRIGCNAGTCHGSAKGKNGFKLSLRGYDPQFDYQALITDIAGRRFNRVKAEESLMLLKPTAEVPHEGGMVLKPDSREYKLLRDWIAQGTKFEDQAKARANRIEVLPPEIDLTLPGMTQEIIVLAHYPDDSVRDVTREAVISSSSGEIATVKNAVVTGIRRGEAAILIRYEGNYATEELRVMGDRSGYQWADLSEYNFIDQHVNAKLQKMKILPSELCTDAEFVRRVSLDLTGLPPKAERVREFLANSAPSKEKRAKLVDELIGSENYVEFWANKWADLLQLSSENLGTKAIWQYRDWIRASIEQNKPYDKFVREILLANGSSYKNPAGNYYRVLREPGKIAEDVSQTFLGVRFNCNKCHDHPFERWTQNQYYEFAAYFANLSFKRGPIGKEEVKVEAGGTHNVYAEEILYRNPATQVEHPKTGKVVSPKVPYGTASAITPEEDRRQAFVDWLASKDNPFFAKAMANRVWSYFFGIGIIQPVDDIRSSNPPSNAALLDALTENFIAGQFDIRQLMRTICNSRTYQLSFLPNKWNSDDQINFSHARPRRLTAEQLYDAISFVTGANKPFAGLPKGMRAVEVADGKVAGDEFLSLFGRPKRQSACECERTSNITLSHAMSLINGSTVGEAVSAPHNAIEKLVERESNNQKVVAELYYMILSRPPTEKELNVTDFSSAPSRLEGAQDLAWALLNSPAFLFNR